jgi:cell division protein ZipA
MSESPWTLRLVLGLFGLAVIAGVYLYGLTRKRRRNQIYSHQFGRLGARQSPRFEAWSGDPQEAGEDVPLADEVGPVRVRKVEPLVELPELRNEPPEPLPPEPETDELPEEDAPKPRAKRKRKRSSQLDLSLPAIQEETPPAPPPPPAEPALITLCLRPRADGTFTGPAIVRNVNAVGMRHGDMRIFHHFGTEELRCKSPLFSLANMFEPGYFDLNRIEPFRTQGLVMFLQLPSELDGPVSFELFLSTAQRLAEGLRAELLSAPDTVLEVPVVERLREQAAAFTRKGRKR